MSISKKIKSDYEKGLKDENKFINVANRVGLNIFKSTRTQDRLDGWDFYVSSDSTNIEFEKLFNKNIDVKGVKGTNYNWVELIGYSKRSQKLGWLLRGGSDFIAFERLPEYGNDFIIVDKIKLKNFIFDKIPLLKEFHERALRIANGDSDIYENSFYNLLYSEGISKLKIVKNKEESLYDVIYERLTPPNDDDINKKYKVSLITRILDSDLEYLHTYKIEK